MRLERFRAARPRRGTLKRAAARRARGPGTGPGPLVPTLRGACCRSDRSPAAQSPATCAAPSRGPPSYRRPTASPRDRHTRRRAPRAQRCRSPSRTFDSRRRGSPRSARRPRGARRRGSSSGRRRRRRSGAGPWRSRRTPRPRRTAPRTVGGRIRKRAGPAPTPDRLARPRAPARRPAAAARRAARPPNRCRRPRARRRRRHRSQRCRGPPNCRRRARGASSGPSPGRGSGPRGPGQRRARRGSPRRTNRSPQFASRPLRPGRGGPWTRSPSKRARCQNCTPARGRTRCRPAGRRGAARGRRGSTRSRRGTSIGRARRSRGRGTRPRPCRGS